MGKYWCPEDYHVAYEQNETILVRRNRNGEWLPPTRHELLTVALDMAHQVAERQAARAWATPVDAQTIRSLGEFVEPDTGVRVKFYLYAKFGEYAFAHDGREMGFLPNPCFKVGVRPRKDTMAVRLAEVVGAFGLACTKERPGLNKAIPPFLSVAFEEAVVKTLKGEEKFKLRRDEDLGEEVIDVKVKGEIGQVMTLSPERTLGIWVRRGDRGYFMVVEDGKTVREDLITEREASVVVHYMLRNRDLMPNIWYEDPDTGEVAQVRYRYDDENDKADWDFGKLFKPVTWETL